MNIGFDAKRYFHNQTGLGNYSRDLVNELIALYPSHCFYLFDKSPKQINLNDNAKIIKPKSNKFLWREHGILKEINELKLDIFHGLSNELPFGKWGKKTKKVTTIHDVIFKEFPQHYSLIDRKIYDFKTAHALNISDKIICTSKATVKQIEKFYKVNPDKLVPIYQTCHVSHWEHYSNDDITQFKEKYHLKAPFILYLSSFQQRKNHLNLLKALKASNNKNINLVLAGKGKETLNLCRQYCNDNNLNSQVTFLNDIPLNELPLLYRSAMAFIYPSIIEGFGIPLIEAACAGLKIATSDIEVFKEIAPNGTLFFNPENVDDLKDKLIELSQSFTINDYGLELQKFNQKSIAKQVFDLYKSM